MRLSTSSKIKINILKKYGSGVEIKAICCEGKIIYGKLPAEKLGKKVELIRS